MYLSKWTAHLNIPTEAKCISENFMLFILIPRSRVLLEKLTGFQLVKKFPAF
jgi:hypothetical protein